MKKYLFMVLCFISLSISQHIAPCWVTSGCTGDSTLDSNAVLIGSKTHPVRSVTVNSSGTEKFLSQTSSGTPIWDTVTGASGPAQYKNPSGLIGFSAVNGSGDSGTRYDATHALDSAALSAIYTRLTYLRGVWLGSTHIDSLGTLVAGTIPFQLLVGAQKDTLASADIWVGSSGGIATARVMSGDVTINNTGVTALGNIPSATPMAGYLLATNITAPSTPASGKTAIYVDATSKAIAAKNDLGTVTHGVQTQTAISHEFVTAISDAGVVSQAAIANADLPTNVDTGSGTANTITKWAGAHALGNSKASDDGTTITDSIKVHLNSSQYVAGNDTIAGTLTGAAALFNNIVLNPTTSTTFGIRVVPQTTTNVAFQSYENAGGRFFVGSDNSTGSEIQTGSAIPYAGCVWTESARSILFGTNNTLRMTIDSAGAEHVTGTLSVSSLDTAADTLNASTTKCGGLCDLGGATVKKILVDSQQIYAFGNVGVTGSATNKGYLIVGNGTQQLQIDDGIIQEMVAASPSTLSLNPFGGVTQIGKVGTNTVIVGPELEQDVTQSTSTSTGSLINDGGIGNAGNLWNGGYIHNVGSIWNGGADTTVGNSSVGGKLTITGTIASGDSGTIENKLNVTNGTNNIEFKLGHVGGHGNYGIINTSSTDGIYIDAANVTFDGTINTPLTASLPVFTDGSGNLTTNPMTGTGSVMLSASPTTTGTLTAAAANFSGNVILSEANPSYSAMRLVASTGTNGVGASYENTGGRFFVGADNSTGGGVVGAGSYPGYVWEESANPIYIGTNNAARMTFYGYNAIRVAGNFNTQGIDSAAGGIAINKLLISQTAPTISSGFGTSPSVTVNNGTASFRINVGTGGTASSGVIGLTTVANGWNCVCEDLTTTSATVDRCKQTASTTTTATIENISDLAVVSAWVASDILAVECFGN